ncbi:MAG: response regulator [Panacagrimonas sp.]|jgi:EAL domain-containing protein (putative c-di-GMP-specific phosphodiesterase class I)/ActR/RegA family two-component response regulator|nr:EAL domain-containing response regulator [Panacagrimonas sp.]MCC2656418.1 response regulator [Panacagrimonas sp.]
MNSGAPLGLLLLEDSPADSRLLVESLREQTSSGTVVIQTVRRLADALRELKRFHFSCVLVDLGLPDGEGVRNVARIREADPGIAIVVLTGLSDERAAEEAFRLGAQDYLIKGERLGEELLSFVRRAIDKQGGVQATHGADGEAGAAEDSTEAGPAIEPLRFQPWVDVSRGRFVGVHAVVGGELTQLSTALSAFRSWLSPGLDGVPLALSIPLNWLPRLVSQLAARVAQAELKASSVTLRLPGGEIGTEPSVVDDLRMLRASGTQVWLEGWRPGCAPLDYLTELPLDGIVIDPRAIDDVTRDTSEAALRFVRATLALGGALGLDVIADGVSLAEQHARLSMVGCTHMQGTRFCRPEVAEEFPARWRKGPWGLER